MKFFLLATIASLASLVTARHSHISRQTICPQAARFGVLTVTPGTALNAGDDITIHVDLTCGIKNFGIVPRFLDYTIEVPASLNNGHEPTMTIARRSLPVGALSDTFTIQIPHGFFFAGAAYAVVFTNIHPINGTDGSEVLVQGSLSNPITINA